MACNELRLPDGSLRGACMDEAYLELLHRVRVILDDLFGMPQSEAEELIDELRDAGIGFREITEE
ncbi:hypothetical protein SEA_KARDASHIAN_63 [Streptomyces phage Kardashian]|nr:hypothetical protein SEA_KARDASHIAN_63 [Streptomyces phage Kardashian]